MRFLIQRVSGAAVSVGGETVGEIGRGFLVFIGISKSDIEEPETETSMKKCLSAVKKQEGCPGEKNVRNGQHFPGRHSREIAEKMTKKLLGLRIFEDENGKTNLDLKSVGGSLLLISQFTLYADCRKGNRPSFTNAGDPEKACLLYRYIVDLCRQEIEAGPSREKKPSMEEEGTIEMGYPSGRVEEGIFGADMKVKLVNDGPFTVLLDSDEIIR